MNFTKMKILVLSITIFLSNLSFGQSSNFKLFLIGDTGEDISLGTTMKHFLDTISLYPNSATVFLGDNSYKGWRKGFDSSKITIKRLGAQLEGLNKYRYRGSLYFIPGNHDWWNSTKMKKGKRSLKKEEVFINSYLSRNQYIKNNSTAFIPKDGNPIGAMELNNDQLKLIFLDTQWLIIQKNEQEKVRVYAQLDSILSSAISRKQKIVVAAHHPIYTISKHSRKHSWQFPKIWKCQDIYHPDYRDMRERVDAIFYKKDYPIIYASGHDHVLEYFRKNSVQYIVSGSGSKSNPFDEKKNLEFNPEPGENIPENPIAKVEEGYFEVDYTDNNVSVIMYYMDGKLNKKVINGGLKADDGID
ncbi:MAG: metallophosphoesterase [Bacteroidia bacterium]|nr:metallophosphoesterase [Bacteroidia bacterium]